MFLSLLMLAACGPELDAAPPSVAAGPREPDAPALRLIAADPTDAPIAGLDDAELLRFEEGDARFELPFRDAQGLGPLFVHRACTGCHEDDARGPGLVRRIVAAGGIALRFGDAVRPRITAGARTPVLAPGHAREVVRLPLAVFARGHLEAIPDETILAAESAQASGEDGVSGRAARLDVVDATPSVFGASAPALGRFGHKARSATLDAFVADALRGDMGLTSPSRPDELPNPDGITDDLRPGIDVDADTVALLAEYVRLLALPRRELDAHAHGSALFVDVGCARCHAPTARTRADHPSAALRDVEVALYTDVLLHDMGDALADGIEEGAASGREWRTAPLVGVRHLRGLLHDGRAASVRDAIEQHASPGSEASTSVARFDALSPADQAHLVSFVEAL